MPTQLRCPARRALLGIAARRSAAALLGGALLLGACSGDYVTAASGIDGTYTLRTVNDRALPTTVYDSASATGQRLTVTVTSASVALSPAGGYTFSFAYTFAIDGVPQTVSPLGDSGTYARNGTSVVFTSFTRAAPMTGTLSNGELTMALDILATGRPLVLVFRK